MLRLLLRTHQNNEHSNGECDFAYVEIDEVLARQISARQQLFFAALKSDRHSYVIHFWNASCRYFKRDDDDLESFVELLDAVSDNGFVEVDVGGVPEKYFEDRGCDSPEQRTECDMLAVEERGFSWKCYPKYFDGVEISTETLPYELLNKLL